MKMPSVPFWEQRALNCGTTSGLSGPRGADLMEYGTPAQYRAHPSGPTAARGRFRGLLRGVIRPSGPLSPFHRPGALLAAGPALLAASTH